MLVKAPLLGEIEILVKIVTISPLRLSMNIL